VLKALLMHVAVDTSSKGTGGINGPIFPDKSFEFIPIPENPKNTSETRTYSTLKAKNSKNGKFLSDFVPSDIQDYLVHFDPDFENFTYADPSDMKKSKRGGLLKWLSMGDYIFFVASLAPFKKSAYTNNDRKEICKYQKGKMAKYIIGYFEIKNIFQFEKSRNKLKPLADMKIPQSMLNQIKHNAHSKRNKDKFIVAVGKKNRNTALLRKAIQITTMGAPFCPNSVGKKIYGNKGYPRGFKRIFDEKRISELAKLAKNYS
jgi:hypothetical protein